MIVTHYIFIVLLHIGLVYSQLSPKLNCLDTGKCIPCTPFEMSEEYCQATKRKMKISCKGYGTTIDDYRSCKYTAQDDENMVFMFQIAMAGLGGLAYWGVQSRKPQNMTRFDHRKQRRNKDDRLKETSTV